MLIVKLNMHRKLVYRPLIWVYDHTLVLSLSFI